MGEILLRPEIAKVLAVNEMVKRALFIKSPNIAWLKIARTLKAKHDIDPSVWVSSVDYLHWKCQELFPNVKFYAHFDAIRAIPPCWLKKTNFVVDAPKLDRNAIYEPIFNNMIDRWASDLTSEPFLKRRLYYIELLQIWYDILVGEGIDLVVMPTIPHRIYDFTAYIVARDLGIPFLMLDQTGEMLIEPDGRRISMHYFTPDLNSRDTYLGKQIASKGAKKSSQLQRYLSTFESEYEHIIPSYLTEKIEAHRQHKILNRMKSIGVKMPLALQYLVALCRLGVDESFVKPRKLRLDFSMKKKEGPYEFNSLYGVLKWKKRVSKRALFGKKFYQKHSKPPDFRKRFVYVASHFQPEKTTTPNANIFQWQELILEILNASIPEDWMIYFKEHPSNFREPFSISNVVSKQYYEKLLRISDKVQFVPVDTNPLQLIDHSQFVASAAGTSSWQAATRGKPGIVFGDVWFGACPAIKRISTVTECRAFVSQLDEFPKFSSAELGDFLGRLENFAGLYGWARRNGEPITRNEAGEFRKHTVDDFCSDLVYAYKLCAE